MRREASGEETVTIVDPRHPLYGRTLLLVSIGTKAYLGQCCTVWIRPGVERCVPIGATDLAFDPHDVSPIPLSLASLRQLLHVTRQVCRVEQGEGRDATIPTASSPPAPIDRSTPGVDAAELPAAATRCDTTRHHLPAPGGPAPDGTGGA